MKPIATFREHTGDVQRDREQERVRQVTDRVNAMPFARGKLVTVNVVTATGNAAGGDVVLAHGLGEAAAAMVVRVRAGLIAQPYESATQSDLTATKQVRLTIGVTSGTPVVDLWMYPAASLVVDPTTGLGV